MVAQGYQSLSTLSNARWVGGGFTFIILSKEAIGLFDWTAVHMSSHGGEAGLAPSVRILVKATYEGITSKEIIKKILPPQAVTA